MNFDCGWGISLKQYFISRRGAKPQRGIWVWLFFASLRLGVMFNFRNLGWAELGLGVPGKGDGNRGSQLFSAFKSVFIRVICGLGFEPRMGAVWL